MSEKILKKIKSVKLDKIVEIIESLWGKTPELEIVFEKPEEFKRERDQYIESLYRLITHYLNADFIDESDTKDCIFNALERFMENVELKDPLGKLLPSLNEWKLQKFIVRYPEGKTEGESSKYWKMIISSEFEKKGDYVYLNVFILEDGPYSLQFEYVIPKTIFKKMHDNKFFEEVEVEKGWEEYIALRTNCKKLLEDKLYWKGKI